MEQSTQLQVASTDAKVDEVASAILAAVVAVATDITPDGNLPSSGLLSSFPKRLRPPLGRQVWQQLVENRTSYDIDTFTWDVLCENFHHYFYLHTPWLSNIQKLYPASLFIIPPGHSLNSLLQNTLEGFRTGAGDAGTPHMMKFSQEVDATEVLASNSISVQRKVNMFRQNWRTPAHVISEFISQNPNTCNNFLTHPNYPISGVPGAETKWLSMNTSTLYQGWVDSDLDLAWLEGRSSFYWKSLYNGIGEYGTETELVMAVEAVDSYEHARTLLEGVFQRPQPLNDIGVLASVLGRVIKLSAGSYLPFEQWWQLMLASRSPLSFAEVDFLLTLGGGNGLKREDAELLSCWLDEDGQLTVDDLDDLPASFRWDIKTAENFPTK